MAAALAVPALAQDQPATVLPDITVAAPDSGYRASRATTAIRLDAPLQSLPLAAPVVPGQLLEDRGVQRVDRALDTVAGVQRNLGGANGYSFTLRGFSDSSATLLDGFREDGGLSDAQSVDRVEVLKGPASALYGAGINSGGSVNVVSKRPEPDPFTRIDLGAGSFGHARATLDANRDVSADGKVLVRLNAAFDRSDTLRLNNESQSLAISPSLTWTPTERDSATILTRFLHNRYTQDAAGTPAVPRVLGLKLGQSFTEPGLGRSEDDAARAALVYSHRFDSTLEYRLGLSASYSASRVGTDNIGRFSLADDGVTLSRFVQAGPQSVLNLQLQNELSGRATTGQVEHRLLGGIDVARIESRFKYNEAPLPALNLAAPSLIATLGAFRPVQDGTLEASNAGAYLQDFATWGRWHALVGLRADLVFVRSVDRIAGNQFLEPSGGLSPRIGLSFDIDPNTTLYGNASGSLNPNVASRGFGGAPLPPTHATQYEAGVKRLMFDGRLSATLAAFEILKTNVPVADLANPIVSFPSGRQESRGVEVELTGRLAAGWNIAAGYAYTFAKQVSGTDVRPGSGLPGVPRHALGLWTSYEFADASPLAHWGGGIGVRAQTKREATLPNTFRLPAFVRIDASLWRRFRLNGIAARIQLDATNLGNAKTYDTDGNGFLRPDAPRSVYASIGLDF